MIILWLS